MNAWIRLAAALPLVLMACGGHDQPYPPLSPEQLRIEIDGPGLYQLTYEQLAATGFDQGAYQPDLFTLSNQGSPVALNVLSADGTTFGPGDALQFYGQGVDTVFTGTNVYWLGQGRGLVPMASRSAAPAAGAAPVAVSLETLHVQQDLTAWGLVPGAPAQNWWFWEKFTAPQTGSFPFQLPGLAEAAGPSSLTISFQGGTTGGADPDHHLQVSVNGTQVGNVLWDGETVLTQTFPLPTGLLQVGANTVTFTLPGDTGAAADIEYLAWFEVNHWTPIQAAGDVASFAIAGGTSQPIQAQGFSGPLVQLFDITDPNNAATLTGAVAAPANGTYALTFQDPSTATKAYYALTPAQIQTPPAYAPWTPGVLKNPALGADYILITPRAFLPSVAPLVQLRQSQGLRVVAAAVEDIYDDFNNGLTDPQAIKNFLGYANQSWVKPSPQYVLLLGDATWDYRNRTGTTKLSQVPCNLSWTDELGLTPDDNWYVALDGQDLLPSMMIGRVPSATPAQAAAVAAKLVAYETSTVPPPQAALFVADNNDASFAANCDALAALLPADLAPTKIYLSNYTNFTLCSQDIINAFNAGMLLAVYSGHGDDTVWTGEIVFSPASLPSLTNANALSFIVSLDCLNGWFAMPSGYCLAEAVVNAPGCGAIASYASSGLGLEWELDLVSTDLMGLMFAGGGPTVGALCTGAKVQAYKAGASSEVLTTLTLIGDPATHLRGLP